MLCEAFPERFTTNLDEFGITVCAGDYSCALKRDMLPYNNGGVAPVLMFASTFCEETIYSNIISMALQTHMSCFQWTKNQK